MEKVNFTLRNGKTRLMKRKMADVLQSRGKGYIVEEVAAVEPEFVVSDKVKAEAEVLGIDLATVEGSGKDGRILKRDLHSYNTRMLSAE